MNETQTINYLNADDISALLSKDIEKKLSEIIQKYDFLVGSMELKMKLAEILPKDANITYSPFIESPTMIYAIKKFDVNDLVLDQVESEDME